MARHRSRTARRLAAVPTILGAALVGALFLAPASGASAAERLVQPPTPTTPQLLTPPTIPDPDITVGTIGPVDPEPPDHPEDPPCTGLGSICPPPPKPPCDANHDGKINAADWPVLLRNPGACRPPKPPCDANHDGKITVADWLYLKEHPGGCLRRPPCDANRDGKLNAEDWFYLKQHPDACRPPKPPCDANGDGKLDAGDWRTLDENPYACQPPDTSYRPPNRIDTGAGGSAETGLNLGQLALLGAVLTGLAGGIFTIPRRRWSTGGAR